MSPDSADTQQSQEEWELTAHKKLLVYTNLVPGTHRNPLHYACFLDLNSDIMTPKAYCVVARKGEKTVRSVIDLLNNCDHPNLLLPGGVWDACSYNTDSFFPCITFQLVDGTLNELPKAELFQVVQQPDTDNLALQAFSEKGLKVWSDLISAVQHVNEKYVDNPSTGRTATPTPCPLKLDQYSILYQKIPTGEYHVLIGDFDVNKDTYSKLRLKKDAGLPDIKQANWTALGLHLETLVGEDIASPEILQLIAVLKSTSKTFDDIIWEPALWDAKTRMHFIRRVAAYVDEDKSKARRQQLLNLPALGLQGCISTLGLTIVETRLMHSLTFLRNKMAAHYNQTYVDYDGPKEDIGLETHTIGRFLLKGKPDYMIKLIKHIRPLGWITKSPLTPAAATTSS